MASAHVLNGVPSKCELTCARGESCAKILRMEDGKAIGAHGGGIPPGWDFPEARMAAEEGIDLWMLDTFLSLTPWQRLQQAAAATDSILMLRDAGENIRGS